MFSEIIWPYLKKIIGLPVAKQTLDSLYCIIEVHKRYPKLIDGSFIPRVLETATELLCQESMTDISKILIFVSYIFEICTNISIFMNLVLRIACFFYGCTRAPGL